MAEERIQGVIQDLRVDITETVEPKDLFPSLRSRSALDKDDCEDIDLQGTRRNRVNYMLDVLERKTNGMTHFVFSLTRKYPDLHGRIIGAYLQFEGDACLGLEATPDVLQNAFEDKDRRLRTAVEERRLLEEELEGRNDRIDFLEEKNKKLLEYISTLEGDLERLRSLEVDENAEEEEFRKLAKKRGNQIGEQDAKIRELENEVATLKSNLKKAQRRDTFSSCSSISSSSLPTLPVTFSSQSLKEQVFFTPPPSRKLGMNSSFSYHGDAFRRCDTSSLFVKTGGVIRKRSFVSASGRRVVDIKRPQGHLGIAVVGGLNNGIFISWMDETLPLYVKKRLKIGDRILKLNENDFTSVTHEEAHAALSKSYESLQLEVDEAIDEYEALLKKPNEPDAFHVKSLFSHDSSNPDTHFSLERGEVYKIVQTLVLGHTGMWKAKALDKAGREMFPPKYVPNSCKARELAAGAAQKSKERKGFFRKKTSREEADYYRSFDGQSPDFSMADSPDGILLESPGPLQGYRTVTQCPVDYKRPVLLLGLAVRQVIERLIQPDDGMPSAFIEYRLDALPNGTGGLKMKPISEGEFSAESHLELYRQIAVIESEAHQKKRHCVIDAGANFAVIDKLNEIHVHPVLVLIKRGRGSGKVPFLNGMSKLELEIQGNVVKEAQRLFGKTISDAVEVEPTRSLEEVALSVHRVVAQHQSYAIWETRRGKLPD
eukprot:m.307859 g.307859  ORF g.307859 m.307859 type:complete len:713 (+) comp42948_c0_seq1:39-2177(+)